MAYRYQEFPRRMYRGEERRTVTSEDALNAALREGFSTVPGGAPVVVETPAPVAIPHVRVEDETPAPPVKRGPGRPRKSDA